MKTKELLEAVQNGSVSVEQAMEQLKTLPYENLGYARLDHHRELCTGFPEVIFSQGKTVEQTAMIFEKLCQRSGLVLATRASREQYEAVREKVPQAVFHEAARAITVGMKPEEERTGLVAVCTGGTADIPVAEEAAVIHFSSIPFKTSFQKVFGNVLHARRKEPPQEGSEQSQHHYSANVL